MKIADYIKETEYPASRLIDDIWHEYYQQKTLEDEIKKLQTVVQLQYRQAQSLMDSDDPDDVMLGAGVHWQTYFEEDKQLFHKSESSLKFETKNEKTILSINNNFYTFSKCGICSGYTVYQTNFTWLEQGNIDKEYRNGHFHVRQQC